MHARVAPHHGRDTLIRRSRGRTISARDKERDRHSYVILHRNLRGRLWNRQLSTLFAHTTARTPAYHRAASPIVGAHPPIPLGWATARRSAAEAVNDRRFREETGDQMR